jgi:phospholipid transport system substrate-binding protein
VYNEQRSLREAKTMSNDRTIPQERLALLAFILVSLMQLLLSPAVRAAMPQERVHEILEAVSTVLQDPQLQGVDKADERKQRVQRIIVDAFDFEEMARLALGAWWDRLTPPQQTEFVDLFGQLFERSYNRLVLRILPERDTTYSREAIERDHASVQTILIRKKTHEQLPVEYRLIEKGGRWAVFDVVVDGVSLTLNYRAQFDKIIRSSSYGTLVEKIKAKLAQEPS